MNNSKANSFLEGPVLGSLLRFVLPVLGALVLQAAYGAVDLLIVGKFGDATSISAVGTGSAFMQMVTFIISSLAMGSTVIIGQHIGEKKLKEAGNTVGTTIVIFVAIGVVLTVILEIFAGSFMKIMLVPSSIMQTVSAFVAQNIGAGQKDRAWKGFITAVVSGCLVGVVIFFAGFLGGGLISSMFTKEAPVIAQSAGYLKGFSIECILTCVLFGSIGYFNGCGKSIPVMIQGITSAFCIRIPVSVLMSKLPNTSLMLVGFATPITTVYGIIFFMIIFLLMKEKHKKTGGNK